MVSFDINVLQIFPYIILLTRDKNPILPDKLKRPRPSILTHLEP